jgi:Holliday junction resolvase
MTPETKFKNQVMKYLDSLGAYVVKQHGNMYTSKGVPDLLVCLKGVFLGIELKAENGKPSELQILHIQRIKEAGGFSILLYPSGFEEFKKSCENIIKEVDDD